MAPLVESLAIGRGGRVTVRFADCPAAVLHPRLVNEAGIEKGMDIPEEAVRQLLLASAVAWARDRALRLLSYRSRSRAELSRRLAQAGFSEETITRTLKLLEDAGLVNDADFARQWVGSRQTYSPRSRTALRAELRAKGVARPHIETAIAEEAPGEEEDVAYGLALRWAARLPKGDEQTFKQRLRGYLMRRGFGYDVTPGVVARVWREIGGADSESDEEE